jgi:hypothetical protein
MDTIKEHKFDIYMDIIKIKFPKGYRNEGGARLATKLGSKTTEELFKIREMLRKNPKARIM